jgi:hypothetical protein
MHIDKIITNFHPKGKEAKKHLRKALENGSSYRKSDEIRPPTSV